MVFGGDLSTILGKKTISGKFGEIMELCCRYHVRTCHLLLLPERSSLTGKYPGGGESKLFVAWMPFGRYPSHLETMGEATLIFTILRRTGAIISAAAMLAALWLSPFFPGAADAAGAGEPGFDETRLAGIIAGAHRAPYNVARDSARHPLATLRFFGLTPDMHVAEIWPGGGAYYAEIIGPYVASAGRYYAVVQSLRPSRGNTMLFERFTARPDLYGQPMRADMSARDMTLYTDNSLDMVVTFRNLHNWADGRFDRHFIGGIFRALKPGGLLGLVDHRLDGSPHEEKRVYHGYVTEEYAIEVVTGAGFEFVAASEANANPGDRKDYDRGVWTLPPTLALGKKDRAVYTAIGESDRMTLLFRKPGEQD